MKRYDTYRHNIRYVPTYFNTNIVHNIITENTSACYITFYVRKKYFSVNLMQKAILKTKIFVDSF